MAKVRWTLIDVDQQIHLAPWQVDATQMSGAPQDAAIRLRRLHGGLSDGVDRLDVHNGRLALTILPTRGMGLWRMNWDAALPIGWQSPVRGPVHPAFVPQAEPSGLGWLDGFDETMCRCGLLSNGAPEFDEQGRVAYALHGHVANRPASQVAVEVEGDQITVTGRVFETRFHFHKLMLETQIRTRFNQPYLEIEDKVTNLSAGEGEMQMLYHTNFGVPLLGAGAELVAPAKTVVPRNDWAAQAVGHWSTYTEPRPNTEERVYFFELYADAQDQTEVMLKDARDQRGVSIAWNNKQLPCFTQWKNETALDDGYVTGLEPGTNFPNPRSFEGQHGRVVKLPPGGSHEMTVRLTVLPDARQVAAAQTRIGQLRADRPVVVHEKPQPTWCAP